MPKPKKSIHDDFMASLTAAPSVDAPEDTATPAVDPAAALRAPLDGAKRKPRRDPNRKLVAFRLTPAVQSALAIARADDGITAQDRVQALLEVWDEDEDLKSRVASRALLNKS